MDSLSKALYTDEFLVNADIFKEIFMYSRQESESTPRWKNLTPDYAAATALLQHLEREQLKTLLDDGDKLNDLLNDLSQLTHLKKEKELLMTSNKSLADFNIRLQPKLDDMKRQVGTGYEELNKVFMEVQKNKSLLDSGPKQQSADVVLALVQTEAAKSEEESEDYANQLCDGKVPLEEFIENFIPKQKIAHLRKIRAEKMAELVLNERSSSGVVNGAQNTDNWSGVPQPRYDVPYHPPVGSTHAPYPTGNSGMPLPSYFMANQ